MAYPGSPNSSHYLPNVLPEAEAVARYFVPEVTRLYEENATPDSVLDHTRGQEVVHLGCHGTFDLDDPEQSGLMLAGGWLTVRRIITELRLDRTRLATVAACLSGRVELRHGEEHVGLVQAMMSAGARAVVASLWPVNDAATRALFEAFYTQIEAGNSLAGALAEATRLVGDQAGWEHPYYWAAFQVSGLAHGEYESVSVHSPDSDLARRIEDAHRESTEKPRGVSIVNTIEAVNTSLVLLQQMTRHSQRVLGELDSAEQNNVVEKLHALDEQAAGAQTEAELLTLVDSVHRLVEDTPSLATLLLPRNIDVKAAQEERNRKVTAAYDEAAYRRSQHAQEYAAQIRNHVVECYARLEQGLQDPPQIERQR